MSTPSTAMRGLGYLPDHADARDRPVRELVAAHGGRFAANQRPYRTTRLLQGEAGACFAFAAARALHVNLQMQGHKEVPIPSPRFLYFNGRAQAFKHLPESGRPRVLEDVGTRPREGLEAIRALGFAAWNDAPYDPRDVRMRPPRSAYMRAFDQRGFTYYRIPPEHRVDNIAAAMSAGASVILCMAVDKAFLWNRGEIVRTVNNGDIRGGHALTVLDVTRGTVDVDNWWDNWGMPAEHWEDDGIGSLSFDFADKDPAVIDVYGVLAAPFYSSEVS